MGREELDFWGGGWGFSILGGIFRNSFSALIAPEMREVVGGPKRFSRFFSLRFRKYWFTRPIPVQEILHFRKSPIQFEEPPFFVGRYIFEGLYPQRDKRSHIFNSGLGPVQVPIGRGFPRMNHFSQGMDNIAYLNNNGRNLKAPTIHHEGPRWWGMKE